MVVFDATMMMLLIYPDSGVPLDYNTGLPVTSVSERIAYFIEKHEKTKAKIGIPTPALSEILVRAGAAAVQIVEKIKEFSVFEILPFDELSAIEVALMTRNAIESGAKKSGSDAIWSKVKYDRQIIATARVRQATAIYSDDKNLRNTAASIGMTVISLCELPVPPEKLQGELPFYPQIEVTGTPSLEEIEKARDNEVISPDPEQ